MLGNTRYGKSDNEEKAFFQDFEARSDSTPMAMCLFLKFCEPQSLENSDFSRRKLLAIQGMAKGTTKKKPFFMALRRVRIVLQWLQIQNEKNMKYSFTN